MENPSLQLGNSNWAVKEGGLLGYSKTINKYKPIEFNVTRATTGTRINADGLIEYVPYNLYSYSERFDIFWGNADISFSDTTELSPNSKTNSQLCTCIGNPASIRRRNVIGLINVTLGEQFVMSCYFKKKDFEWVQLNPVYSPNFNVNDWANFNLTTGTIGNTGTGAVASIEDVGNGWFLCSLIVNVDITSSTYMGMFIDTGNTDSDRYPRGLLTEDVEAYYMWGAQLTKGNTIKPYYRTNGRLNIPRLDYSNGSSGILIESQKTNYFINNSYSDKDGYTHNNYLFIRKPNQGIYGLDSIEGVAQTEWITGQTQLRYTFSLPVGNYTHTFYIRKNCDFGRVEHLGDVLLNELGESQQVLSIDTTNGTMTSSIGITTKNIEDKGDWWKISYVIYCSGGGTSYFDYEPNYTGANYIGASFEICGSQIENGQTSTSFIQTTTATVTRNADVITKTDAIDLIGQTEGTIFLDTNLHGVSFSDNVSKVLCEINLNNTVQNRITIYRYNNLLYYDNIVNGAYQGGTNFFTITDFIGEIKIALTYQQNNVKVFVNGVLRNTDTSALIPECNTFNIGSTYTNTLQWNGTINNALLWKTQLTDEEAINLTTL